MLSVPSLRLNQFGVRFYEALLSGADLQIARGLRGAVLRARKPDHPRQGEAQEAAGRVNWEFLEKKIAASEQAYQRPIIQRKIEELVAYYLQCADSGTLPAIPGSVLLVSDRQARLRVVRERPRGHRHPEAPGGIGHPARPGRPAPAARPAPARREAQLEGLPGPRRRLRRAHAGPGRRALRHDQQQAHEAEPVASDLALGPAALPRRESRRRARRDPEPERGRALASPRADQGARHRQGHGHAGLARRRASRRFRRDGRGRRPSLAGVPRRTPAGFSSTTSRPRRARSRRRSPAASIRSRARRRCVRSSGSCRTSSR